MSELIIFLTALIGLIAIILKQIFGHKEIVKRLNKQDETLDKIDVSVNNHLVHEIMNINAKLDNLPCKVTPCSKN